MQASCCMLQIRTLIFSQSSPLNARSPEHPAFRRRLDAASDTDSGVVQAAGGKTMPLAARIGIDAVTGIINAVVSLPVMMSFAVIIFKVCCHRHT